MSLKGPYVTRRKLMKIFSWLRNKKFTLKIVYEYNNSMCMNERREYTGIIDKFSILDDHDGCYKIDIQFTDGNKLSEWINCSYEFTYKFHPKHIEMSYCNSGPYCYFIVDVIDDNITIKHP